MLADRSTEPVTLEQLIPFDFDAASLGCTPQLLRAPHSPLRFVALDSPDELSERALDSAARSCAPYSGALSGVALRTNDGEIFCGSVIESAAYNPTLGPMQAALIAAHHGGARLAEIREAVLVELERGEVSQLASARLVLASVAPAAISSRRYAATT